MTYYFAADLHLGHRMVSKLRWFPDVETHDAFVLDGIARLSKHDILWVLGDLTLENPERAIGLLAKTPCRKRLILGNHDKGHPMHKRSERWHRRYYEAFEYVGVVGLCQGWLLSHFPYADSPKADRTEEIRYSQWRLLDHGQPLLHGHLHSHEKRTSKREVHVGLDAWGLKPVSLEEVEGV